KAGSLAEAYVKAQAIYNKWSEVESQKWQSEMKTAVKKLMPDMSALVWEIQLRRHNKVDVGGSFRLERWGGHGQYALWLPSKTYFPYTASNLHQASMFLRAMINQQKLPLTDPPLQIVEKHLKSVLPTVSRGQGRTYLTGEMLVSVTNQRIEVFNRHKLDKKIGYVQLRRGVGEAYKNNRRMDKFKLVRRLAFPEGWKSQTRLDIAILWAFYLWL
ncbi:MAG: hypothetical protein GY803_22275, partial [Chloroflexi bacterium]|nr:hypothetical protein [Chloroflexota bacterium]